MCILTMKSPRTQKSDYCTPSVMAILNKSSLNRVQSLKVVVFPATPNWGF